MLTYPVKVALAKIEQLEEQDLLEYGVSASYAWPTPEGLKVLEDDEAQERDVAR